MNAIAGPLPLALIIFIAPLQIEEHLPCLKRLEHVLERRIEKQALERYGRLSFRRDVQNDILICIRMC